MPTTTTLRVALVNNMPGSAFVDTEGQFAALLGVGPGQGESHRVSLELYAPPERLAGAGTDPAVGSRYRPVDELFASHPDGVVVTGSEPSGGDLRGEPLWGLFERIFDWAPEGTGSLWLACLAAHAALAHYDGLGRRPLPSKYSAVLEQGVEAGHPLTAGIPSRVAVPHSRANEVPTAGVAAAGYRLAIASERTGWTVATGERGGCLLVAVQGHPEYRADTLLREYRRDVRRFLAAERDDYPALPAGYLDDAAVERLEAFRRHAESDRSKNAPRGPGLVAELPFSEIAGRLEASWAPVASRLGRNWLATLAERASGPERPAGAPTHPPAAHPQGRPDEPSHRAATKATKATTASDRRLPSAAAS